MAGWEAGSGGKQVWQVTGGRQRWLTGMVGNGRQAEVVVGHDR
jgi:hypothetical protein